MSYPVKWFSSDMGGAPILGDTAAGDFIALLKACLIDGFNVTPITSLTYSPATGDITAQLSSGHGFTKHQVIAVSGANEAEYNGEHRVVAVGDNWISYTPASVPLVPSATGSALEVRAAPVGGWEVVAEDAASHKLALRRTAPDATEHVIVVTNDGAASMPGSNYSSANVAHIEAALDFVDLATYATEADGWWAASHRYSGRKEWLLVADGKTLLWAPRYSDHELRGLFMAGDVDTLRPGDAAHCVVAGIPSHSAATRWDYTGGTTFNYYSDLATFGEYSGNRIARAHTQLPGAASWSVLGIGGTRPGGQLTYPNPADNGLYVATGRLMVVEAGNVLRGYLPGLLQPLQKAAAYDHAIIDNLPGLDGEPVLFLVVAGGNNGTTAMVALRLGAWRSEVGG